MKMYPFLIALLVCGSLTNAQDHIALPRLDYATIARKAQALEHFNYCMSLAAPGMKVIDHTGRAAIGALETVRTAYEIYQITTLAAALIGYDIGAHLTYDNSVQGQLSALRYRMNTLESIGTSLLWRAISIGAQLFVYPIIREKWDSLYAQICNYQRATFFFGRNVLLIKHLEQLKQACSDCAAHLNKPEIYDQHFGLCVQHADHAVCLLERALIFAQAKLNVLSPELLGRYQLIDLTDRWYNCAQLFIQQLEQQLNTPALHTELAATIAAFIKECQLFIDRLIALDEQI